MASAVADLEAGLQAMLNLKPPGVSGSRIISLTQLCVSNIQVCLLIDTERPRHRIVADPSCPLVGIGSHPEDIHALQEGSRNAQVGCSLRCRLGDAQVAGAVQVAGPDNKWFGPGWHLRGRRSPSNGTDACVDE